MSENNSHGRAAVHLMKLFLLMVVAGLTAVIMRLLDSGGGCSQVQQLRSRFTNNSSGATFTVGVMVTKDVAASVIEALHYRVQEFNAVAPPVRVRVIFFVGQEGHLMLDQRLACDVGRLSSCGTAKLPEFAKGAFAENMNDGKTYEWFRYAAAAFPDSSWIAKMDTDVAVDWERFTSLLNHPTAELHYLGFMNTHEGCGRGPHCPLPNCSSMDGSCWVYMSGGFYGVTAPLARALAACDYYKSNRVGLEDLMFGKAVKACAPQAVTLHDMLQTRAWCHSKAINATHIRNGIFPQVCETSWTATGVET